MKTKASSFDDLLRTTGGFGRYQAALFAFLCLVSIPAGAQVVITVFYGASPLFICVQTSDNETCDPGKCCSSCKKYEFRGPFTSAVSEVIVALCKKYIMHRQLRSREKRLQIQKKLHLCTRFKPCCYSKIERSITLK